MKYLFILCNLRGGGAQRAILNTCQGLAERGHEVILCSFEHGSDYPIPAGVKLDVLSPPGEKISAGFFGKRSIARKLASKYRELARKKPIDVIISSLPLTDEIVSLARLPAPWFRIANTLSQEIEALKTHRPRKAARRLARYRKMYSGARLIAVSNGVREDLHNNIVVNDTDIEVIYNPFDLEAIRQQALRRDPDLPKGGYIVHAGRFEPQKRYDILFDAYVKSGINQPLVLLVTPSLKLREMIAARNLTNRVILPGFRPNPYPWYAHAGLLVLSSDREGLPNAMIEALCCGTPAASTDCPSGPREVLRGDLQKFLSPVGDSAALARCMQAAYDKRALFAGADLSIFSKERALDGYERLAHRK